ncbi:MAG: hypothetical protein R3343_12335 [Nitriliruptorales bacterium]|nr:hypothetical protein [Nitriliruptorales bacterium]
MTLDEQAVRTALGDRPVRVYPAVVSTEADAQSWARSGAPAGAVVVASYQAAPRGRAGLEWEVDAERDLVFSMVVRPELADQREGWLYVAALTGIAETLGAAAVLEWPDEIVIDGDRAAMIGWHVELGPGRVDWAVLTVWRRGVDDPPDELRGLVAAVESSLATPPEEVLTSARRRCATLGRRVRALLIPMGPSGPRVEGEALDLLDDGALLLATPAGGRIPVTPQALGQLEPMNT